MRMEFSSDNGRDARERAYLHGESAIGVGSVPEFTAATGSPGSRSAITAKGQRMSFSAGYCLGWSAGGLKQVRNEKKRCRNQVMLHHSGEVWWRTIVWNESGGKRSIP